MKKNHTPSLKHNASEKIIWGTGSDLAIRKTEKLGTLCSSFVPHMQYFEEGVGLCPWALTECLCLSLQGQQTLFLNAVIGNSVIQWNYIKTEFGLKHYYVALKMFSSWSQKWPTIQEFLLRINTGNSIDVTLYMWHAGYLKVYLEQAVNSGKQGEVEFCLPFESIFTFILQGMCMQHSANQVILLLTYLCSSLLLVTAVVNDLEKINWE